MLFENEPGLRLLFLIGYIWDNTRRLMEKQLRILDITWPQLGALAALSQNDRITQRELSEIVDVDTTTVMVVCDSLEKKNLIQRLPDPSDRRVNRLVLTDCGKETIAKVYPQIRDGCKDILAVTPVGELNTTVQVLENIRGTLSKY